MIGPSDHLQLTEATIEHDYSDSESYERVKEKASQENISGQKVYVSFPIHRDTSVNPEDTDVFGYNISTCVFQPDRFLVHIPRAPRMEWLRSSHNGILRKIEELFQVQPYDDEFTIYHEYGIPNIALTSEKVRELVNFTEYEIESLDKDWFKKENETYGYLLPKGTVYIDTDENSIMIDSVDSDTAEDVRENFSIHLDEIMAGIIDSYPLEVEPDPRGLFSRDVLYPALALNPDYVRVWNSIANKLYDTDLVEEETPILRERLKKELGNGGHESLLSWLHIASSIQNEIPAIGQTENAINNASESDDGVFINWFNSSSVLYQLRDELRAYTEQSCHEYSQSIIDEDELLIIPAEKKGVTVGARADRYEPVINLKDDWEEDDRVDDYFWAEGVWWFDIIGAKPYDHRFSAKHVNDYLSSGGEFPATKRDIEVAQSTSMDFLESDMTVRDSLTHGDGN